MKLSLSWLREYLRLGERPERIAELLTEHAFETAVVSGAPRADMEKVRVGEVISVAKHPNADRLSVATVRLGKNSYDIVCGAPNVRRGMKVALALAGATLIDEEGKRRTLEAATIRGVKSPGMICSERELGLGTTHEGIVELPPDARVGEKLSVLFPEDVVLEAEVLPDRSADCLSQMGVARELGAILRRSVRWPKISLPTRTPPPPFQVTIRDRALCPRYLAIVLEGIRSGPSPLWMQARLRALGTRPQHLIVDVTNYVLWETGQPTHAFDARTIGLRLGVRETRGDEQLTTLDGEERRIPSGALVITSDDAVVALAGIMGGASTAVREDTSSVVLEAALFDRARIRKTAREMGMRTDASDRFSKSLTAEHAAVGAARAAQLLQELGGARVTGMRDVYPRRAARASVSISHARIEAVLGMTVSPATARSILKSLGYGVAGAGRSYRLTAPMFRTDVLIPEDVIEDVGRIVGYKKLPSAVPRAPLTPAVLPPELRDIRTVQDAMKSAGWMETYSYSFMPEEEALLLELQKMDHLRVVNPVNRDHVRLRVSLLPNLLHASWGAVKKEPVVRLFEVGRVFPGNNEERLSFAGILARRGTPREEDFYDVKGVIEHVCAELRIGDLQFNTTDPTPENTFLTLWEPGQAAEIASGKTKLGFLGRVRSGVLERVGIRGGVIAFEIHLSRVFSLKRTERVYNPPLLYPTVQRDVSLWVPHGVLVDTIQQTMSSTGGELVQDVDFIDMYEDSTESRRSVTLRITYGSAERTLRDEEVNALHRNVLEGIRESLGVEERT